GGGGGGGWAGGGGGGGWQADMYLEGSDQHRGWFQSSLLLSLAGNGAAPYRAVLTHGFMVDADRQKISKSRESKAADQGKAAGLQAPAVYEKPQTADRYVDEHGADVVRLWVASQDFRNDVVVSVERIRKVGETYRVIRNALRYELANLFDFDPARHRVSEAALTGLDRWMLGELAALERGVAAAYEACEFHAVYQKLSQFAAVELSAVYHDVVKDRLYTDPAGSARRRSTQTALHRLVETMCKMLAPLLAFTADEAWESIPGKAVASVHLAEWVPSDFALPEAEQAVWRELFRLRDQALMELERARQAKTIGKSLEAKLTLSGSESALAMARAQAEAFRELVNVSQLEVVSGGEGPVCFAVSRAEGEKCERCWHWDRSVGSVAEHPTICARCVEAVSLGT
ncbi:MAG: class I tRNA ligase family protein, partial [Verrucomicrobia bacterium]|nr:class I tRNA ligase family protein [Verrucomicrobiota bacterium]